MKLVYPACFYPCIEIEGGYTVEIPDLPGCVSEGNTLADAILMATDAASGWVLDELEDGNAFAEANHINFSQVLQDSLTAIYQQQVSHI